MKSEVRVRKVNLLGLWICLALARFIGAAVTGQQWMGALHDIGWMGVALFSVWVGSRIRFAL